MENVYNFYIPTRISFGKGRVKELGKVVSKYGNHCLLVTGPLEDPLKEMYNRVKSILINANIQVTHFDGVVPNPTMESIDGAMKLAKQKNIDCVIGLGGGSAIDSAKIIALTYKIGDDINWQYIFENFTDPFSNYDSYQDTLPLFAVSTTSGTGSHVTQATVVTNSKTEEKLTIFHQNNFPLVSIVDPELILTMPARGTAATGFDVFAHAFESYLGSRTSPLTEWISMEAIKIVVEFLPKLLNDLNNISYRSKMAWADTLAGICLANGGASIPHPLSEIIGGVCSRISHGECLALVYPEFLKYEINQKANRFASIYKYILPGESVSDQKDAESFIEIIKHFIKDINLWSSLKQHKVTESEYDKIINNKILGFLPFASKESLQEILRESYERK